MDNQQFRPTLLDVPVSFFEYDNQRNSFANVPSQQTTLRRMNSTGYYRPLIEQIRAEADPNKQGELKKQLPAITPVSLLYHRRAKTTFSEKIKQQWPLLTGDIDQKDNPGINMAELKTHLARLPYVVLCAYSVRGGLWFVVRLPDHQTPETLAAHFRYLKRLFNERFGIALDTSKGGNPTDLRFVSHDAAPFVNEAATVMNGAYTPQPPTPRTVSYSRFSDQSKGQLLTKIVRCAENSGPGTHHQALLKAATLAGGYIAAGRLDEQTAVLALETVASEWRDLSQNQRAIKDGIIHGQTMPLYADEGYQRTDQPPAVKPTPLIVRTLAEWAANPGSILRPYEDQIERL
ncbi:hypothetical protein FAES_3374 [Fibrella aestuarina BUZ 2]|uniref:Uncharacterized protein n=1 Tax=Fibrella aestuarina BUZ 2 TaxID=1166018 RepID=I0KB79_9BACT|nr:BT4734/BF3469 family protein [Fibrella aestuarina]CCH01382.1 hypothetical protein FAES_3374 [Fibrella aestuarina BUZ 2]